MIMMIKTRNEQEKRTRIKMENESKTEKANEFKSLKNIFKKEEKENIWRNA